VDTKGRFAIHWGAPETYGERREESALRRAGRTVPDPVYEHFHGIDLQAVDDILDEVDHDPKEMLRILAAIQAEYGYVPVAALKRVSQATGAWYAMLYGTATYYDHLAVGAPGSTSGDDAAFLGALDGALGGHAADHGPVPDPGAAG
jgi:Thioredoxin-like [2Fe-2S] ferredoxin